MEPLVHEIDVRERGSRAQLRPNPLISAEGSLALASAGQCVIFIHGFANSRRAASKKYRAMMRTLTELAGGDGWNDQQIAYFGFHWPGNHWMPIVNQLTFAGRIPTASNAGGILARARALLELASPVTG